MTLFDITAACIAAVKAQLRSGELIGPDYAGDMPTGLAYRDGKWCADDPKRPFFRLHNLMPWELSAVRSLLVDAVQKWTALNTRGAQFAHWGGGPGWDGVMTEPRGAYDTIGHWCASENWLHSGDYRRWNAWLDAVKAAPRRQWTLAQSREIHTHFYRLWLSGRNQAWVHEELLRLGRQLASAPLRQHGHTIWHPAWIKAAYLYGVLSDEWVVEAARDLRDANSPFPLSLAALAWRITKNKAYLEYQLPRVMHWVRSCYQELGSLIHGYWPPQQSFVPQQWSEFEIALRQTGIDVAKTKLPAGGYPYSIVDRGDGYPHGLVLRGNDLRRVLLRWKPLDGGPPQSLFVRVKHADGTVSPEVPIRMNEAFSFAGQVVELYLRTGGPRASIQMPVTDDQTERAVLSPGVPYEVGNSRAVLETEGEVHFAMQNWWLNLAIGDGPQLGYWTDRDAGWHFPSDTIELAGHDYGRADLTLTKPGTWRAATQ